VNLADASLVDVEAAAAVAVTNNRRNQYVTIGEGLNW